MIHVTFKFGNIILYRRNRIYPRTLVSLGNELRGCSTLGMHLPEPHKVVISRQIFFATSAIGHFKKKLRQRDKQQLFGLTSYNVVAFWQELSCVVCLVLVTTFWPLGLQLCCGSGMIYFGSATPLVYNREHTFRIWKEHISVSSTDIMAPADREILLLKHTVILSGLG